MVARARRRDRSRDADQVHDADARSPGSASACSSHRSGGRCGHRGRGSAPCSRVAIAAPNLAWQVAHGWPSISFLRGQNARVRGDNPTTKYITDQLFSARPVRAGRVRRRRAPTVARCTRTRARAGRGHRRDRVPRVPRQGVLPTRRVPGPDRRGRGERRTWRRWRVVAIGLVVWAVGRTPDQPARAPREHDDRVEHRQGTRRLQRRAGLADGRRVDRARVPHGVPEPARAHSLILTQNYSQASAVNLLGARLRLPQAYSGHNTYWLWLPPHASIASVVAVGFTRPTSNAGSRASSRWARSPTTGTSTSRNATPGSTGARSRD